MSTLAKFLNVFKMSDTSHKVYNIYYFYTNNPLYKYRFTFVCLLLIIAIEYHCVVSVTESQNNGPVGKFVRDFDCNYSLITILKIIQIKTL